MSNEHPVTRVRPFAAREEYEAMVDYFLQGGDAFLEGMGVDVAKLPSRRDWVRAALEDHARGDEEKERFYVAWVADGEVVGHSSISHIVHGESAHFHMHMWRSALRGSGLGPDFLRRSIDLYFERFALRTLACEPFADNPGPNKVCRRLGFRRVRRYRTVPTGISSEQDVQRYELAREEWRTLREGGAIEARG